MHSQRHRKYVFVLFLERLINCTRFFSLPDGLLKLAKIKLNDPKNRRISMVRVFISVNIVRNMTEFFLLKGTRLFIDLKVAVRCVEQQKWSLTINLGQRAKLSMWVHPT